MAYFLVTFYIKNEDDQSNEDIANIPYKSVELEISDKRLLKFITAYFKKYTYICYCNVMDKYLKCETVYRFRTYVYNPYYSEEPIPQEYKPKDVDDIKRDDVMNQVYMTSYESSHKGFEINLENEQKVIRLGSYFYDLKGVLICEATDEDREKYYCDRYVTFPIVDDDWRVYDGKEIANGINSLIVGKKGDTIPLIALEKAADYNAREHDCSYDEQLVDLEQHGITISNRKHKESAEEFSDNVVIGIDKIGKKRFRMDADWASYYVPTRFFYVGEDDELYEDDSDDGRPSMYQQKLVDRIVDDVWGLSWFFNKPNLRVLITAITDNGLGFVRNKLDSIPKDWFYTVQTLEAEVNQKLDEMHKKYPDDYNRRKRPDNIENP
jgi:hypothetical protein